MTRSTTDMPLATHGLRETAARGLARARAALSAEVSIQSLAVFRILFGALLVWDTWRFVEYDRIWRYYVAPEVTFTYPGFGWVQPLPEPWIHIAWGLVGVTAFLVMIGLFYRVAIVALTVLFSYFFLLDKAQYLNHFYMVILYLVLMCFLPANRAWSLDARLRPGIARATVPYASVFILRLQIEIILIYAGIVKITEDWLKGEPLGMWLRPQADAVPFGALLHFDWVIVTAAWGTILLHIVGAPLLLWKRTRLPVFLVYCAFHMSNAYFFNIGIFPWLTIGATLIVFAPDWPSQLARRIGLARGLWVAPATAPMAPRQIPIAAMAALALWVGVQVAVPLRHHAFPTEVRWTGDGHRFAWRMRMYDREADGYFLVAAEGGRYWVVEPEDFLTARQARGMLTRPDMIWQFAAHLERVWAEAGHGDVAVHAHVQKSLNGRAPQPYIDPDTDLTAVRYNLFGPDPWVLPLTTPFEARAGT
jgi:vitamin K-dependent gamma-carboxylase